MGKMIGTDVSISSELLTSDSVVLGSVEKPVDSSSSEPNSPLSNIPSSQYSSDPGKPIPKHFDRFSPTGREKIAQEEGTTSQTLRKGSGSMSDAGSYGTNSTYVYSHEPFETFKLKIIQLCCDIGWGEPSEVEHIKGGSYHRIIGVKFGSRQPQEYVFRIARMQEDRDFGEQVKDEVAIHHYLSQFLPIPKVAAFDKTKNNVLQCSYILQGRILGKGHEVTYYGLPLAEKLQVTTKVAEFIQKMEAIKFDRPGRLAAKSDVPLLSNDPSNPANNVEIAGFREGKMSLENDWPLSEAQSFKQLVREILVHQRAQYDDGNNDYSLELLDPLILLAEQMEIAGLIRNVDMQYALWHWDFASRNIMIEETTDPGCVTAGSEEQHTKTDVSSTKLCSHNIQVDNGIHKTSIMVELPAGTAYKHTFKVIDASTGTSSDHSFEITTTQTKTIESKSSGTQVLPNTPKNWKISGVLDWDNVLSVPVVISRQPPQWLWCEEENRSTDFTGNFDISPSREFTQDELLIKGHFDQIMSHADPTYFEDAYGRGIWLRRLVRMALDGFGGYGGYQRAEVLIDEWQRYFASISGVSAGKDIEEEECEDGSDMDREEDEADKRGDIVMKDDGSCGTREGGVEVGE